MFCRAVAREDRKPMQKEYREYRVGFISLLTVSLTQNRCVQVNLQARRMSVSDLNSSSSMVLQPILWIWIGYRISQLSAFWEALKLCLLSRLSYVILIPSVPNSATGWGRPGNESRCLPSFLMLFRYPTKLFLWVVGLHCSDLLMQACRPAGAAGRIMAHVVVKLVKLPTNMANIYKLQIQTTYIIHMPAISWYLLLIVEGLRMSCCNLYVLWAK